MVDANGVPVREAPFRLRVYPYESCAEKGCEAAHSVDMSRDTDESGIVRFDIFSRSTEDFTRVIDLIPLFDSKNVIFKNVPIIEKAPFVFTKKEKVIPILLAPGGGLEQKFPTSPDRTLPATKLPVPANEPETGFPWGAVAVGAGLLLVGIFAIPMILGDDWGRDA